MKRETHIIDAENKIVGRLAVEIVELLRGKNKSSFMPNKDEGDLVLIKNIEKIKFTGKKMDQKKYFSHSGYLGHEKFTPAKVVFEKKPSEVLRRAVYGMLPKNKLRNRQIKRLKFV